MKTQNGNQRSGTISHQPFAINYTWADSKGRMHLGRSVGTGRDRAHAERRFFNQHRHVMRDEAGCTVAIGLLAGGFITLLTLVTILAVKLDFARDRLAITELRLNSVEAAVDKIALREAANPSFQHAPVTNVNWEGGVK